MHEALSSVLFCAGYPRLFGLTRLSAPPLYFQSQCGSTWVASSCTTAWDYILQTWALMGLTAFTLCLSGISILCCLIFSALRIVFFFIYFVSTFLFSGWMIISVLVNPPCLEIQVSLRAEDLDKTNS